MFLPGFGASTFNQCKLDDEKESQQFAMTIGPSSFFFILEPSCHAESLEFLKIDVVVLQILLDTRRLGSGGEEEEKNDAHASWIHKVYTARLYVFNVLERETQNRGDSYALV